MSNGDLDNLARWLAAEREGLPDEADALFHALAVRHLRPWEAPATLADRIMAALPSAAGSGWRAAVTRVLASRSGRASVAAAVGVLGIGLGAASPAHVIGGAPAAVEGLAQLVHGGSTLVSAAVYAWGASWSLLVSLGMAAAAVASSGNGPVLIGANLLLACGAGAGLCHLLAPREEYS
jgi:hypothetical protein